MLIGNPPRVTSLYLPLHILSICREMRLVIMSWLSWRTMKVLIAPLCRLSHGQWTLIWHQILCTRAINQIIGSVPWRFYWVKVLRIAVTFILIELHHLLTTHPIVSAVVLQLWQEAVWHTFNCIWTLIELTLLRESHLLISTHQALLVCDSLHFTRVRHRAIIRK